MVLVTLLINTLPSNVPCHPFLRPCFGDRVQSGALSLLLNTGPRPQPCPGQDHRKSLGCAALGQMSRLKKDNRGARKQKPSNWRLSHWKPSVDSSEADDDESDGRKFQETLKSIARCVALGDLPIRHHAETTSKKSLSLSSTAP